MKGNTHLGIVVKVTGTHISLLCQDGNFKNIPRSDSEMPQIGEHYTYVEKSPFVMKGTKYLALVAVLFLMIAGYFMRSFMVEENAYLLALDINPSIEIYTNEEFQVTKVEYLNEDGKVIVDSLENKTEDIYVILEDIIASSINENYLTKEEKGMVNLTVIPLKKENQLDIAEVQEVVDHSLNTNSIAADVFVENGNIEIVDESREANLSINKMQLYNELTDKGLDVNLDELREKSIAVLKDELIQNTNDKKDTDRNEEIVENKPSNARQKGKDKSTVKKKGNADNQINNKNPAKQNGDSKTEPQNNTKDEKATNKPKGKNAPDRPQVNESGDKGKQKNSENSNKKEENLERDNQDKPINGIQKKEKGNDGKGNPVSKEIQEGNESENIINQNEKNNLKENKLDDKKGE